MGFGGHWFLDSGDSVSSYLLCSLPHRSTSGGKERCLLDHLSPFGTSCSPSFTRLCIFMFLPTLHPCVYDTLRLPQYVFTDSLCSHNLLKSVSKIFLYLLLQSPEVKVAVFLRLLHNLSNLYKPSLHAKFLM
jgi:hypothetical protein